MKTYFVVVSALLSTVSVSVAKADGLPQKYLPQPIELYVSHDITTARPASSTQ